MAKTTKTTKKTAATKEKPQPTPAAGASSAPMIDTGLAAASVAKTLLTRAKFGQAAEVKTSAKESGAFKQLKEGLTQHPSLAAADSLNTALGQSKSELPRSFNRSPGHGQVVGHAGPSNLPRRTNG